MIKVDVCEAFDKLYDLNGRDFRTQQSFLHPCAKKPNAKYLFDFRSISLIHLFAKLFAKVVSFHLALCLVAMVFAYQNMFIIGRNILTIISFTSSKPLASSAT